MTGDNFSAEWPVQAFRSHGVTYQRATLAKSQIYVETLPYWNRGLISMPNVSKLTRELRLLERRTHRSGRDTIDHGVNGSDDYANALCGCAWLAQRPPQEQVLWLGDWGGHFRPIGSVGRADSWGVNNVSPPCTVPLPEPHPQTIERWARHAEYLRTVAAAEERRRNQFAVDPVTGQSTIGRP